MQRTVFVQRGYCRSYAPHKPSIRLETVQNLGGDYPAFRSGPHVPSRRRDAGHPHTSSDTLTSDLGCHPGSEQAVAPEGYVRNAAKRLNPSHVVRLTGRLRPCKSLVGGGFPDDVRTRSGASI